MMNKVGLDTACMEHPKTTAAIAVAVVGVGLLAVGLLAKFGGDLDGLKSLADALHGYKWAVIATGGAIVVVDLAVVGTLYTRKPQSKAAESSASPPPVKVGNAEYEGHVKEGKPHGKGTLIYPDGTRYEGYFVEGRLQGKEKNPDNATLEYEGEIDENNQPHGRGKYTSKEGYLFEGMWENGKPAGMFEVKYPNGNTYTGGLDENLLRHGVGKLLFPEAALYIGEWEHGSPTRGKMTYADGNEYDGAWKGNKRHGQGKMTCADGRVLEGQWDMGTFRG